MASIDYGIIDQLLQTRLLTASTSIIPAASGTVPRPIFFAGDRIPDGLGLFVKMGAPTLTRMAVPRSAGAGGNDEPDIHQLALEIQCAVSQMTMDTASGTLSTLLAEVYRVMGQFTAVASDNVHQVHIMRSEISAAFEFDESRQIAAGTVKLVGQAIRLSGTSVTSFL